MQILAEPRGARGASAARGAWRAPALVGVLRELLFVVLAGVLVVVLLGVLVGCAAHGKPEPAAPAATTPAEVVAAARGTLEQWRQAYEVRSPEAMANLYTHDTSLSVVQDGTVWLGWTVYEPVLRDRLARATTIHVRLKDVQVSAVGLTGAVIVATMLRERADATTAVTENGVLTLVLRNDATWVIVAEHYSYKRT